MAPAWLEKFIVREDPTPDPRRSSEQPALLVNYAALADHRRTLTVEGEEIPCYEIKRQAILGAWGDKCLVTAPANGGKDIAIIDFHAVPRAYAEIQLLLRNRQIEISTAKRNFTASGGLGVLQWKGTGMDVYGQASWELRDETSLVISVDVNRTQGNGVISLWRNGLDAETIEELVIVGLTKIEEYKQMLRSSKISLVSVVV